MPPLLRRLEAANYQRSQELADQRLGKGPEEGKWWMQCSCTRYGGGHDPNCRRGCDEGWLIVDAIEERRICRPEDHTWTITFECGSFMLECVDPHSEVEHEAMARWEFRQNKYTIPGCRDDDGILHDGLAGSIKIKVKYVDDSTASTPAGPAEYGYYYTFEVIDDDG